MIDVIRLRRIQIAAMSIDLREAITPDVLDLIREAAILRDLEGRVLYWNKAAAGLYGWTTAQALGKNAHQLLNTRQYQPMSSLEEQLRRERSWRGKLMRTGADGSELIVDARWSLRHDAQGLPLAVLETSRDITARKPMSPAARDHERRYHNLFESPAAAFFELDFREVAALLREVRESGVADLLGYLQEHPQLVRKMMRLAQVIKANDRAIEKFGAGDERDLLGSSEKFWPEASTGVFAESVVAAVSGQPNFVRETTLRTVQGVEFDAEFAVHFDPEKAGGGPVTVGIVDLTKRNQARAALEHAEFMYRNLFHGMALPFFRIDSTRLTAMFAQLRASGVVDLDEYIEAHPGFLRAAMDASVIVEANALAAQMYGVDNVEELNGPISRFFLPGRDGPLRKCFVAGFAGGPGYQTEAKVRGPDGRDVDVMLLVIATPEMRERGIVLVGHIDIREQVAARAALERMQSDLAHAARVSMLGELTASIAHEVNQPLTAITTNAEAGMRWLGRPEPDVAEARTLMTRVVADARRAADIIQRVRGMAARRTTESAPLPLNGVIEEAMLFLQHEMQARNVQLLLELATDLPDVHADRIQMQQVIVNLAVNAIQAMVSVDAERRRLRIVSCAPDAQHVFVQVEDSGPGIAAENMPHLFERFYSTKGDGMGMGLPICQSIIEAHGGRIEAANNAGVGARFSFVLPVEADTKV